MKLYLLKRDHHEGQCFYGVFESKELAQQNIKVLMKKYKNIPEGDFYIKEIILNELTEIEAYDEY